VELIVQTLESLPETQEPQAVKILIINVHSTQNAGDAALLTMAVRLLRAAFPGACITVAMNLPDASLSSQGHASMRILPSFMAHLGYGAREGGIVRRLWAGIRILVTSLAAGLAYRSRRRLPGWVRGKLGDLLSAYAQAGLIVSCPGNIFATRSRFGLPFLLSALTVAYASLLGKPLYVLPQSIGPLTMGWQRALVRQVYSSARIIQVREPVSFRLGLQIGLPAVRLRLIPDPALVLPVAPSDQVASARARLGIPHDRPMLGVTAINRLISRHDAADWDRYESAMAHALRTFLQRYGGSVIFCPQVTGPSQREDDRVAARRIATRMGNPNGVVLVDEPLSPELLKGLYGLMDLFVATRLHSGIFAVGMRVPTLLIEYLAKTRGLAELMGLEEWRLDLSEISDHLLWNRLEALWLRRTAVRQHLSRMLPPLEQQALLAGQLIAEDFHGH
jgi:colanic acid/amylovoran biosynthesis protein